MWPAVLKPLGTESLAQMLAVSRGVSLKKGETLWCVDQPVSHIALIQSGIMSMTMKEVDGTDVLAGTFRPSDLVIVSLKPREPSQMTLIAVTDATLTLVPTEILARNVYANPWLVDSLLKVATERLCAVRYMSALLRHSTFESRLAAHLWMLSVPGRDGSRILSKQISQSDIAKFMGVSREEVSRKRTLLKGAGYLVQQPDGNHLLAGSWLPLVRGTLHLPSFMTRHYELPSEMTGKARTEEARSFN